MSGNEKSAGQQQQQNNDATAAKGVPKVKSLSEVLTLSGQKAFRGGISGFAAMGIQGKNI